MLYGRFAITMSYHKKVNAVAVSYLYLKVDDNLYSQSPNAPEI